MSQFRNRFSSLSPTELRALSPADVARWIDLIGAEDGISLLPPEPVKPEFIVLPKDAVHFKVGEFRFGTRADAEAVAALINKLPRRDNQSVSLDGSRYSYSGVYQDVPMDQDTVVQVTTEELYKPETAHANKDTMRAQKAAKEQYDAERKVYDAAAKSRAYIAEEVNGLIEQAHTAKRRRDRAEASFARYLELADGDRAMATKFFRKSEGDAADLIPDLLDDGPQEAPGRELSHDEATAAAADALGQALARAKAPEKAEDFDL